VVSLRQHGFLVYLLTHSLAELQNSIIIIYNVDYFGLSSRPLFTVLTRGRVLVVAIV